MHWSPSLLGDGPEDDDLQDGGNQDNKEKQQSKGVM